jgi:hypothetical protein
MLYLNDIFAAIVECYSVDQPGEEEESRDKEEIRTQLLPTMLVEVNNPGPTLFFINVPVIQNGPTSVIASELRLT